MNSCKYAAIEKTEGEIRVLQAKLKLLKEMEKHKSPAEIAFEDWWGKYPTTTWQCDRERWNSFEAGYNAAQKDYEVGEYQPTPQEPEMTLENSGEFSIVSYDGETYYRNLYDGICGGWYKTDEDGEVFYLVEEGTERKLEKLYQEQVVVEGPEKEQQIKELVRESVKWCEEHREESMEDYLTPQGPHGPVGPGPGPKGVIVGYEPTPQTPEQVAAGLKKAFREAVKQGVVSSTTKPQTLNDVITYWYVFVNEGDGGNLPFSLIENLVNRIGKWLPDEIALQGLPGDTEYSSGWNDCLKVISNKLR